MNTLTVPTQFCGPPRSGNGGWVAGALAEYVATDRPVEVTLQAPPPLEEPLTVIDGALHTNDGTPIASARPSERQLTPVPPVSYPEAEAVSETYPGLVEHPFPTCVACGTEREPTGPNAGLRIFPGLAEPTETGSQRVAAPWTPHKDGVPLSHATTWAAMDCVGGWAGDFGERLMVLGRMSAQVFAPPTLERPHVVVGERLGQEGRKTFTRASLYDGQQLLGTAEHVWIAVDPALFN